jgi:quinolinate synthase
MKLIDLEQLAFAMETMQSRIEVDPEISSRARQALDRMLQIS